MTLIKCPHCGHSVLSVASRCATCNRDLGPNFLGPEHVGELAECRSCGNPVRSGSRFCPKCGATSPARRSRITRPVLSLTALFLLGVLVIDRWPQSKPQESSISEVVSSEPAAPVHIQPARMVAAPDSPATKAEPPSAPADDPPPAATTASTDRAGPAAPAGDPTPSEVRAAEPQAPVHPASLSDSLRQTRWTRLWVNVRQLPLENSPIVRVLRPGTRIEGQERRWGWWVVYVDGDSAGYVAGNLLSMREPTDR